MAFGWFNQGVRGHVRPALNGVVTVYDTPFAAGRPYVFAPGRGDGDDDLWLNWWTGTQWAWSNMGPPLIGAFGPVAVTTVQDNPNAARRPYAFMQGGVGAVRSSLLLNWWTGTEWRWDVPLIGGPLNYPIRTLAATTIQNRAGDAQRPIIFAGGGNSDTLWEIEWTGTKWKLENALMRTTGVVVATTFVDVSFARGPSPYVFAHSLNGELGQKRWIAEDARWEFTNLGKPPGLPNSGTTIGVTTVQRDPTSERAIVFVRGDDGNLWLNSWTGSESVWENHGSPPQASLGDGIAVTAAQDSPGAAKRFHAFMFGSDGNVWLNWSFGDGWDWANLGKPPFGDFTGPVGVSTFMDHPLSARIHVFVATHDGSLWRLSTL